MKKLAFLLFIFVITLSIAACGNTEVSKTKGEQKPNLTSNEQEQDEMKEYVIIAKIGPNPEDYVFEPAQIKVKAGEKVRITLKSDNEIQHALWLPNTDKPKIGNDESFVFTAKQPGEILGKCAELCGTGHALMSFKVIVE